MEPIAVADTPANMVKRQQLAAILLKCLTKGKYGRLTVEIPVQDGVAQEIKHGFVEVTR